jgi:hypothetical protein
MIRVIFVALATAAALAGPAIGSASANTGELCAWKDDPFGYPVPEEACVPLQCRVGCDLVDRP